jgi:ABC-type phosphate transport system substrate-binding protein
VPGAAVSAEAAGDVVLGLPLAGVAEDLLGFARLDFKKPPKDKGPVIVEFLKWVVADGQKFAAEMDYAPLPAGWTREAQELPGTVTFE